MARIAALLAGLVACAGAGAQVPAELAGTWVWPVEDRSLFVLTLKPGAKGEVGVLQHPARLSVSRAGAGAVAALSRRAAPDRCRPIAAPRASSA